MTYPPTPPTPPSSPSTANPPRLWLSGQAGSDASGPDAAQFDALTDLFLGEVSRPRRAPAKTVSDDARPQLRLTSFEEVEATAPAIPPAQAAPQAPIAPPRTAEAFVECLIVGNLPVLASAWASQYVREIAEIGGRPVASLRLQSGYATVDLVGAQSSTRAGRSGTAHDLEAAIREASLLTDRWVIRVDPADELTVATRKLIRLVTLLTGADESARVSTYATLKQLAERLPAPDAAEGESGPVVRVAIMSAAGTEAGAAAARIVETARKQLGRSIQHAICSAKIKATHPPIMLFNGKTNLASGSLLELLERLAGNSGASRSIWEPERAHAAKIIEPAASLSENETSAVDAVLADLQTQPVTQPESQSSVATTQPPEPIAPTPAPIAEIPRAAPIDDVRLWMSASPTPSQEPAHTAEHPLADHLTAMRAVPITCPYAADVQFALDAAGILHILARGLDNDEGTLGRLMAAAAWAESHRALINAALGGSISEHKPTLHLFTSRPRDARRLLDTDVRIHILAPVTVEGRVGWCCAELN